MAWTKYQLFLAGLMLVTGSINTLSAKWADNFVAPGCGGSQEHSFQHPFLQVSVPVLAHLRLPGLRGQGVRCPWKRAEGTVPCRKPAQVLAVGMFLGELFCLAAFYLLLCRAAGHPDTSMDPQQPFNPLLFLPPALCDMTATSIMYVALNMTSASSFQMLRGAVIIFTGLFSVTFLGRRLALSQWLGILATIAGLVVVGLADLLSRNDSQHKLSEVITGDLLIIMAQIIVSIQMVLEEKFVYKHNVHPLRAVGTEGLFGFVILSLLLVPMYYIPAGSFSGNPRGTLEDALDAFCQVGRQPLIALALLGNISSIAFFNFAGISVTKELSATTRMVLDSLRTIVIWAVSLTLGWEAFHPLQILGFLILLTGTALYNGLHRLLLSRLSRGRPPAEEGEHERLLGGPRTAINDAS
ncbi:solute carrier family 35 member F6 isoform X2 [Lagenorhynchus albirostris]|uniref:solute carrier family 35 member F6 isoform X2 n=2 Tax=Lagenorhynchus albirostris TaxID=27610 RepID=UPI0028F0FDF8|nr:solute carrier family 35 member F6 isoform X2 [Lagenorhynchus albirostris]